MISVLDKVIKPGILSADTPDGRYQYAFDSHGGYSPGSDFAKSLVLDLAPPLYDPTNRAKIYDRSGKNNHGTIVGATWQKEPSGIDSLRYDGDDYVNIDSSLTQLASTTKGTWMTWVKLDDATPGTATDIFSFCDTDAAEGIRFEVTTDGKLSAILTIATINQWRLNTTNVVVSDGVNLHVALIQDATEPVICVNGIAVAQSFDIFADKTKWLSSCTGVDNGRLGCRNFNSGGNDRFITNGNTALTTIINTNLTVAQVKARVDIERKLLS